MFILHAVLVLVLVALWDHKDPLGVKLVSGLCIAINAGAAVVELFGPTPAKASTLVSLIETESAVTNVLLVILLVAPLLVVAVIGGMAFVLYKLGKGLERNH
jgi:nitrate reductase NapE component